MAATGVVEGTLLQKMTRGKAVLAEISWGRLVSRGPSRVLRLLLLLGPPRVVLLLLLLLWSPGGSSLEGILPLN